MWKVSPVQMAVRKPKPNLAVGKCTVGQESGAHTTLQTGSCLYGNVFFGIEDFYNWHFVLCICVLPSEMIYFKTSKEEHNLLKKNGKANKEMRIYQIAGGIYYEQKNTCGKKS